MRRKSSRILARWWASAWPSSAGAVQGFAVQAMARRPGARELIVGVSCNPVFGPVMLYGTGGTEVELHKKHAEGLPPLNASLA